MGNVVADALHYMLEDLFWWSQQVLGAQGRASESSVKGSMVRGTVRGEKRVGKYCIPQALPTFLFILPWSSTFEIISVCLRP